MKFESKPNSKFSYTVISSFPKVSVTLLSVLCHYIASLFTEYFILFFNVINKEIKRRLLHTIHLDHQSKGTSFMPNLQRLRFCPDQNN